MAFENGLSNLITNGDEWNVLRRTLMQSIHDHGGGTNHLNRLLEYAKTVRVLTDEIARLIVGPIWQLVLGEPVALEPIDFDAPAKGFCNHYRHLNIMPGLNDFDEKYWVTTRPRKPCRYRLFHYSRTPEFDQIVNTFQSPPESREHAGWRELLAYVSMVPLSHLVGHRILAAGTENKAEYPRTGMFPCAWNYDDRWTVGWKGVKRHDKEKFEVDCFYLIRVYD